MRRVDEVAKKLHGKIGLINAAYNSSDPVERRVARAFLFLGRTVDGGPGSGNYGHQGRPGEIGGSGKGGGKAFRTGSKESGYVGMRKNPVFSGIAEHARANDDYHVFIRHLTSEQKETLKNQHKNCGTKESLQQYSERVYNMLHASKAGKKPAATAWKAVEGKDITRDFKWDKEKFPHEINAVIHQQGFDGKPKIVSSEEFDRIVKEHPEQPLLFRSYTAPDKETLAAYDKQLEGGDWYVDCGTGGAQYGQGMYCAGVYNHKDNPYWKYGAQSEMRHYRNLNESKNRSQTRIDNAVSEGSTFYESDPPSVIRSWDENGDAYYEVGQESKTFENDEELRKLTEPNKDYFITWEEGKPGRREGVRVYTDKDGYIFHAGGREFFSETDADGGNLKITPLKRIDTQPKSTTRQMTLDPSAKIIKHDDIRRIREETNQKNVREFLDSVKDPAPYIEDARKSYLGSLEPKDVNKEALESVYSEIKKNPAVRDELMKQFGIRSYAFNADEKLKKQAAYFFCGEAYGYSDKERARLKPFFDIAEKNPAFKAEVERLRSSVEKKAKIHWRKYVAEHSYAYPQIPRLSHDDGIFAASLGYDAINAEGHGETGSYTVVLNRTKVILNRDPWEVN